MNRLYITWFFYLILHTFSAVAQQDTIQLSGVSGHHLNMEEVEPGTYRIETTGTDCLWRVLGDRCYPRGGKLRNVS